MPRLPLVSEPKLSRNKFARTDKYNDLFRRCLRSEILPDRNTHFRRFKSDEVFAGLYITKRNWDDDRLFETDGTPFRHEKWLDSIFWRELDNPRVCLVGPIGAGKSTLIDYYLRCYCPNTGNRSSEFAKKLVLHFDAREVRDNHESYQHFYGRCQALIRTACSQSTPSFDIDDALRRRQFGSENVARWVQFALEEISSDRTPFGYVVVVLDNLDNSPIDVQRRLIRDVEFWLTLPTIRIWKVFLPLWPTTLSGLQRTDMAMLRGVTQFRIGSIDDRELLHNRIDALKNAYRLSLDDTEMDVEFRDYLNVITPIIASRLGSRLRTLTHSDLRSELSLWDGILTSQVVYTAFDELRSKPKTRRTFEYDLLSSLVSGPYEQHHRSNVIRNIFVLGHNNVSPRDLLVAYHGLTAIERGNGSVNSWYQTMTRLGYSIDNLQEVEENFREMNAFHQTPDSKPYGPDSYDFHVHNDVVTAYLELVTHPAYIDSICQVTPIDDQWRSKMTTSRADRYSEFVPRVESSVEFIDYLMANESAFKNLVSESDREFAGSIAIPSIAHAAATRYLERLHALESSDAIPDVAASWWKKPTERLRSIVSKSKATLEFN